MFQDGHPEMLKEIARRKSKKRESSDSVVKTEDDVEDAETLKGMNTLLMKEVLRLQKQADQTQGAVKMIMDDLIESRKETKLLRTKVADLENKFPSSAKGSSFNPSVDNNNVETQLNGHYNLDNLTNMTLVNDSKAQSTPPPQNGFGMGDDVTLLGLEELAHLELTSPIGLEPEFASILQVPLSPQHPSSPHSNSTQYPPSSPSYPSSPQQYPSSYPPSPQTQFPPPSPPYQPASPLHSQYAPASPPYQPVSPHQYR
jgi:hypothetical protein